jgi:hypothetical protein
VLDVISNVPDVTSKGDFPAPAAEPNLRR